MKQPNDSNRLALTNALTRHEYTRYYNKYKHMLCGQSEQSYTMVNGSYDSGKLMFITHLCACKDRFIHVI